MCHQENIDSKSWNRMPAFYFLSLIFIFSFLRLIIPGKVDPMAVPQGGLEIFNRNIL